MVYPDPRLAVRASATAELRRLAAALVSFEADDALLAAIAESAGRLADQAETGAPLPVRDDYQARRYIDPPPPDGALMVSMSERPLSGPANVVGFDFVIRREGNEAVGVVRLDRRAEASPNRAHGGLTAALFDDVMGYVNTLEAHAAYTRDLTVRYLAPFPLHVPVTIRARVTERSERRCTVTAEATDPDGTRVGEAVGTFAIVAKETFGL